MSKRRIEEFISAKITVVSACLDVQSRWDLLKMTSYKQLRTESCC